jgi:hypothetical protein
VHEYREGIENIFASTTIQEPEEGDVETIYSAGVLLSLFKGFQFQFHA